MAAGNLVDLIDVDDAKLGLFNIPVSLPHQIAYQILHVAAHVAGFAELGGIALDKRDADLFGDQAHHIGLTDTRGTDH